MYYVCSYLKLIKGTLNLSVQIYTSESETTSAVQSTFTESNWKRMKTWRQIGT
jgi:hypothetical protein